MTSADLGIQTSKETPEVSSLSTSVSSYGSVDQNSWRRFSLAGHGGYEAKPERGQARPRRAIPQSWSHEPLAQSWIVDPNGAENRPF